MYLSVNITDILACISDDGPGTLYCMTLNSAVQHIESDAQAGYTQTLCGSDTR